jgi:hypothetical protein
MIAGLVCAANVVAAEPPRYGFGSTPTPAEIAAEDIDACRRGAAV